VQVAVLNGVNLGMLGRREPEVYGTLTLDELETRIYGWARELRLTARCQQTNHEGAYVEAIHEAATSAGGVIVNPGAWTHYSYAIRDALAILAVPVIEVHLSDVDAREEWRRRSVISDVVTNRIAGRGADGYRLALEELAQAAVA
jgi:3-dehydroquinate dehydratase-2